MNHPDFKSYVTCLQLALLRTHMQNILKSGMSARTKYQLVFNGGIAQQVYDLVARVPDISFSWDDPDADYEDDLLAFVRGVDDFLHKLEEAIAAMDANQFIQLCHEVVEDPFGCSAV